MRFDSVDKFEPKQLGCLEKTNADSRRRLNRSVKVWLSRPRRLRRHGGAVGAKYG